MKHLQHDRFFFLCEKDILKQIQIRDHQFLFMSCFQRHECMSKAPRPKVFESCHKTSFHLAASCHLIMDYGEPVQL